MASISIPYGYRSVQLAEKIAADCGGVVLEQHPAGFVTVEASPRLVVKRSMVREAYGGEVAETTWRGLAARRHGVIATLTSDEIEIRDDVLLGEYLVHLPPDLGRDAEAHASANGQSLRDFVTDAIRDRLKHLAGQAG